MISHSTFESMGRVCRLSTIPDTDCKGLRSLVAFIVNIIYIYILIIVIRGGKKTV